MKSYENFYNIILELKFFFNEFWEGKNVIRFDRVIDT